MSSPSVADHPPQVGYKCRLGEPLPHLLANTTQVHLVVMHLHSFNQLSWPPHAVLAIVSNSYPRYQAYLRYFTRSQLIPMVCVGFGINCAFYLHVLGHAASVRLRIKLSFKRLSLTLFRPLTDFIFRSLTGHIHVTCACSSIQLKVF